MNEKGAKIDLRFAIVLVIILFIMVVGIVNAVYVDISNPPDTARLNAQNSSLILKATVTRSNEGDNVTNMTFYYNNTLIGTNHTLNSSEYTFVWDISNIANGTYIINATLWNQTSGDVFFETNSTTITVDIDAVYPTVSLDYPSNGGYSNGTLIYTPNDANIDTCILYTNRTGSMAGSAQNSTTDGLASKSPIRFDLLYFGFTDGPNIEWTVWCNDTFGNINQTATGDLDANYSFTLDTTNPSIAINDFVDNTNQITSETWFNFTVTDANPDTCIIYTNYTSWLANTTVIGLTSGTKNSTSINLSDGTYVWNVWCNDSVGNEVWNTTTGVATNNWTLTIDTTAPTITLATANYTNSSTNVSVLLNFTVSDVHTPHTCSLYTDVGTWGLKDSGAASSLSYVGFNYNFTGDGTYVWNVWCNDSFTNEGFASDNYTITVDATAPVVDENGASASSVAGGASVVISINLTDATTGIKEVMFLVNGVLNETNVSGLQGDYNFTYTTVASQINTTLTFIINATDFTGNNVSTSAMEVTVSDNLPPTITLNAPEVLYNSSSSDVLFNFTASDNVDTALTCNISIANTTGGTYGYAINLTSISATADTAYTTTQTGFNDGNYTWNVSCMDTIGNGNSTVASRIFTVDATAPVVDENGASASSVAGGASVVISINLTDATTGIKEVMFLVNGVLNETNVSGLQGDYNFTYTTVASQINTTLTFIINATDFTGNNVSTSAMEVTVSDNLPPTITLNAPVVKYNSTSSAVLFNFTASDNVDTALTCNISIGNSTAGYAINLTDISVTADTAYNITQTGLNDGDYTWNVTCMDTIGNGNLTTPSRTFTVDTKAPYYPVGFNFTNNISSLTPNAGDLFWMAVEWTDTSTEVEYVEMYLSDNLVNTTYWNNGNAIVNLTFVIPSTYNGTYNLRMTINDTVGNTNQTNNYTITVSDNIPPTIALDLPVDPLNTTSSTVLFNFTASDGVDTTLSCNITVDEVVNITGISATADTAYNATITGFNEGSHTWNVTCADSALNTNTTIPVRTLTVDTVSPLYDTVWFAVTTVSSTTPNTGDKVYFATNWTDATFNVDTVQLRVDGTAVNTTHSVTDGTPVNLSYIIPSNYNGTYNLTMWANDTMGLTNETTVVQITVADTIVPTITLNAPTDLLNTTSASVIFNFTASDNTDTTLSCNITVDEVVNITGISATADTAYNATITGFNDGSHTWNVTCTDSALNVNTTKPVRTVTVDTVAPQVTISAPSPAENSNMTKTSSKINVTVVETTTKVSTFQYNTTCNSTLATFVNDTAFYPFNNGGCSGSNGTQTLYLHVTDYAGKVNNSVSIDYGVDTVAPAIWVTSPAAGQEFSSANVTLNFTTDDYTYISTVKYYLDEGAPVTLYTTTAIGNKVISINTSYGGYHTIVIEATDALSNAVNASSITFSVEDAVDINGKETELNTSLGPENVASIDFRFDNGTDVTGSEVVNSSLADLAIDLELNTSADTAVNMTLAGINASAVVWGKVNMTIVSNNAATKSQIKSNFSMSVIRMVTFDSTIDSFLPSVNSYYGSVVVPYNMSDVTDSKFVVMWFQNESDYSDRTLVSECTDVGKTTAYLKTTVTACYNITSNMSTTIFVPHFSTVALANDTIAPTVSITTPIAAQLQAAFVINVTVPQDTETCKFMVNDSGYYNGAATSLSTWTTMTRSVVAGTSTYVCTSVYPISLSNSTSGSEVYNLTLNVTDSNDNQNITYLLFDVGDKVVPTATNVTNRSITSSGAVISVASNEYANASVTYGSGSITMQTSPFTTKTPSITLSLAASTRYNYTVTVCDYAGVCTTTIQYNLTTDAAASDDGTTSSSSGGGGGGGVVTATTNVAAKTSHMWSSLAVGETIEMKVSNSKIGISLVTFTPTELSLNVKLQVASLKGVPSDTGDAAEKVYQYLEITPTGIASSEVAGTKIKFEVTKMWLLQNGITEDNVALWRYNNDKWSILPTTLVESGDVDVVYEATTPGFSYFAIGTKTTPTGEDAVVEEEITPTEEPAVEPTTPTEEPAVEPGDMPIPPTDKKKGSALIWIILAIAAIVVVAGIVYTLQVKNKK